VIAATWSGMPGVTFVLKAGNGGQATTATRGS
jgi:hypothetical protein